MMKIAKIFALVFALGGALLADDRFPAFETKAIEMKFPVRNFAPQLNSGEELSAGKLTSKFTGGRSRGQSFYRKATAKPRAYQRQIVAAVCLSPAAVAAVRLFTAHSPR